MVGDHIPRSAQPDSGGPEIRLYAVDNIIFRVSVRHLQWRAQALRRGAWREIPLTGQEVIDLIGVRELPPEEAAALPA